MSALMTDRHAAPAVIGSPGAVRTPAAGDTHTLALATLGAMTSRVAHDLRNALAGIELYAAMLGEQCEAQPDLAGLSGRLLLGVKQLRAVAGNLLAVTRRAAPESSPVEVVRLVAETLESAAPAAAAAGIRVVTRAPAVKVGVLGDAERLRQALLNLVLNAIQAMPAGGTLAVTVRAAHDRVRLAVRDTGIGMDRATARRAFEPYFTTRPSGTGLGLAIVREVAAAHGGRVTLTSRPGRGTTVRLDLPPAPGGHEPAPAVPGDVA
jgi:signal transduction histidine kinase